MVKIHLFQKKSLKKLYVVSENIFSTFSMDLDPKVENSTLFFLFF